jgi:hypothetical protein
MGEKRGKYNVVLNKGPFSPAPCDTHNMKNKELGYVAHTCWMQKMIAEGNKQTQCKACGRWLFPSEM